MADVSEQLGNSEATSSAPVSPDEIVNPYPITVRRKQLADISTGLRQSVSISFQTALNTNTVLRAARRVVT